MCTIYNLYCHLSVSSSEQVTCGHVLQSLTGVSQVDMERMQGTWEWTAWMET